MARNHGTDSDVALERQKKSPAIYPSSEGLIHGQTYPSSNSIPGFISPSRVSNDDHAVSGSVAINKEIPAIS